jgi:hypothetical protein
MMTTGYPYQVAVSPLAPAAIRISQADYGTANGTEVPLFNQLAPGLFRKGPGPTCWEILNAKFHVLAVHVFVADTRSEENVFVVVPRHWWKHRGT